MIEMIPRLHIFLKFFLKSRIFFSFIRLQTNEVML